MMQFVTLKGLCDYQNTVDLMESKVMEVINDASKEVIYLLEHSDIYTAGTSYKKEELLKAGNIPVIVTGRGGKFTYHGKGQRIIYPILNLAQNRQKDLKLYVRLLEEWMIRTLSHYHIAAYTIPNKVGIWVKYSGVDAKIGAIGVRVKKWVTYHGVAINISTDLQKFTGIIPCGLEGSLVTSFVELGIKTDFEEFDQILKTKFQEIFER